MLLKRMNRPSDNNTWLGTMSETTALEEDPGHPVAHASGRQVLYMLAGSPSPSSSAARPAPMVPLVSAVPGRMRL